MQISKLASKLWNKNLIDRWSKRKGASPVAWLCHFSTDIWKVVGTISWAVLIVTDVFVCSENSMLGMSFQTSSVIWFIFDLFRLTVPMNVQFSLSLYSIAFSMHSLTIWATFLVILQFVPANKVGNLNHTYTFNRFWWRFLFILVWCSFPLWYSQCCRCCFWNPPVQMKVDPRMFEQRWFWAFFLYQQNE